MTIIVGLAIIIFSFILISIITNVIKQTRLIELEKRFSPFSLQSTTNYEISLFDQLEDFIWKQIHKLSKTLRHSHVLQNYAEKYERFITFEEKESKESIDYISLKFFLGFVFILLNSIAFLLKHIAFNPITCLIAFFLGFFLPDVFLNLKFKKKRDQVEEDLLKAIIIMNNSFKSGRSIMQAIDTVKQELNGPIADEFKKIYLDITYGLSLEVVFNRFYERVKLEDAKYITSSLTLLNKTGGNIVRVFESIEKSIFNKKKLQNELKSLTAASVFVFRVLVCLPFFFTLVIFLLNPTYFVPLYTTALGITLLFVIISLFVLYVLTIKKVLKVKME